MIDFLLDRRSLLASSSTEQTLEQLRTQVPACEATSAVASFQTLDKDKTSEVRISYLPPLMNLICL